MRRLRPIVWLTSAALTWAAAWLALATIRHGKMGGLLMPDWLWFVLLLLSVSLVSAGLIYALLHEAEGELDSWWAEEPHPDVTRLAAFPDRGLDA